MADDEQFEVSGEALEVRRRRYKEARASGLSIAEAKLFADSTQDIGWLRRLVAADCPRDLMARIII